MPAAIQRSLVCAAVELCRRRSSEDAEIVIDFAALEGGFLLPAEADPVWAGDVDRMFLSLVPPGYGGTGTACWRHRPWDGLELSGIACDGAGSVLAIGDGIVPEHGLRIATGYDDLLQRQTPARLLRNAAPARLSRRRSTTMSGMSHYFRLAWNAVPPVRVLVDTRRTRLSSTPACAKPGTADFAARAAVVGI